MGIESFYVNIKIQNFDIEYLNSILNEHPIYQSAFSWHWDDCDHELSFTAAIINFLPACKLLFKFCELIGENSEITEIETRGERHAFDFQNFIEFFTWCYRLWEEKLEYFYHDWGAFIVHPTHYYKARRKLGKKFMLRFYSGRGHGYDHCSVGIEMDE